MPTYLCIDYGQKHCGLAVATSFVADALETVPTAQVFDRIKEIILEYHVTDFVVGISENHMAEESQHFAKTLVSKFPLSLHFHDETLTSQETRLELAKLGAKKKTREAKIDHYVAARILQDFLDSQTQ